MVPTMRALQVMAALATLVILTGCGSDPPRQTPTMHDGAPDPSTVRPAPETPADPTPAPPAAKSVIEPSVAATVAPAAIRTVPRLTGDYAGYPAAIDLIERLSRTEGFDRNDLYRLFSRLERQNWILDYLDRPKPPPSKGPTGSWGRYRAKFLTEDRIAKGVRFWGDHAKELRRASARYGVPPEYIVAIIGVETHYGANVGRTTVIDALATLAFDYPRRSDYFRGELEAFLIMSRDEAFDPFEPVGSYAGAMGLGQFMPSSFHRFAVDFDGDGRRDLWNPVDAIGSVANYLSEHGWQEGEAVAVAAVARGRAPHALKADYTTRYELEALARNGVTTRIPLDASGEVSLLRLDGTRGYEYWVGLRNFYVITRYNHSTYYAMAVHQLAQAVRERRERAEKFRLSSVAPGKAAMSRAPVEPLRARMPQRQAHG